MRLALYQDEKSVAELAARLFEVEPAASRETLLEIERTLLRLNPHLADLANVQPNAPIFVPDVPGVQSKVEPLPSLLLPSQRLVEAIDVSKAIGEAFRKAASDRVTGHEQDEVLKQMAKNVANIAPILQERIGKPAGARGSQMANFAASYPKLPEAPAGDEATEDAKD